VSGSNVQTQPLQRGGRVARPLNWQLPVEARIDANRQILDRLSRGLSVRNDPTLGPLVRPSDAEEPIQRWFHYREGYTAELCRRIFSPDETFVADPFCGFGSTLLAARNAGLPSVGLDVSPLATFVSRVKTRTYSGSTIRAVRQHAARLAELTRRSPAAPAPTIRILNKLFHPDILHALLVFRAAIDGADRAEVKEFLLFAWIAILERVSNVYREGNGVKYRNRQRHGNTYSVTPYEEWEAQQFPRDKFSYVKEELLAQLDMMLAEAGTAPEGPEPAVEQRDASAAVGLVPAGGASLALFSPPYCNCFNYIKAYKLELWMAGFIRAYPDIRALTAMGVRSRTESLLNPINDPYPTVIDQLVGLMAPDDLWSPQLPDVVRGYFADMQRTLTSLAHAVRRGGRCVIVVGNSAYAGVLIPSDLLLARIATAIGFEVEEIVVSRHLTTSSQQKKSLEPMKDYLRESIIHLRRPRRAGRRRR
jgi:hypothetical protein